MLKYVFVFLFFISGLNAIAQDNDSLFAIHKGVRWVIKYELKQGENTRMLAQRYYVSERDFKYEPDFDKSKKIAGPGAIIYIPATSENYSLSKPSVLDSKDMHELYYRVGPKDDIALISTYAGVTRNTIRTWNNLHGNSLVEGQVLFIGWLKMMVRDTSDDPTRTSAYPQVVKPVVTDVEKQPVLGSLDTAYNRQTNNGLNVLTEKGTAVFFEKGGKNTVYVAFHNATPRGTIIKVFNPGTNKTIYVKVLGPVPDTKLYANSTIGICDAAKEALGITDNKAWVELSYPAN